MKKKKLNTKIRNHIRIVERFKESNEDSFFELLSVIYNYRTLYQDFGHAFEDIEADDHHYILLCSSIARIISDMEPGFKKLLDILIKRVQNYFKQKKYVGLSADELLTQPNMYMVPALHDDGLSPVMILFYFLTINIVEGEDFEKVKVSYLNNLEKNKKQEEELKSIRMKLEDGLRYSDIEIEMNIYCSDPESLLQPKVDFFQIAERFDCDYDPDTLTYSRVDRGVLGFFFLKLKKLLGSVRQAHDTSNLAMYFVKSLKIFANDQRNLEADRLKLKMENLKLLRKIKGLRRQVSKLSAPLPKKKSPDTMEREVAEVRKENYYLKNRIESLEDYVAELEEEKNINKKIEENITIKDSAVAEKGLKLQDYFSIVISGGHWNSRTREEVIEVFPNNEVTFIPAERTIRNIDTIENADLVLYDTSRHSHGYYYLVKKKASKLLHINKSACHEVKKLFNMKEGNVLNVVNINEAEI